MDGMDAVGWLGRSAVAVLVVGCSDPFTQIPGDTAATEAGTSPTSVSSGPGSADGTVSGGAGTGSAEGAGISASMGTGPGATGDGASSGEGTTMATGGPTTGGPTTGGPTTGELTGTTSAAVDCASELLCVNCFTCGLAGPCSDLQSDCSADEECTPELACVLACGPFEHDCQEECVDTDAAVDLLECLYGVCPPPCSPVTR